MYISLTSITKCYISLMNPEESKNSYFDRFFLVIKTRCFQLLQDHEWKKLLYQAFLCHNDMEREDEISHMENQIYAAELAYEKHFATKLKVIRDGLLTLIFVSISVFPCLTYS